MNDQTFEINSIENLMREHEEIMEIDTESDIDLESEDFNLDQIIDSAMDWASSPSVPDPKTKIPILPSNESTPSLELKLCPSTSSTPIWRKRNLASYHSIPFD